LYEEYRVVILTPSVDVIATDGEVMIWFWSCEETLALVGGLVVAGVAYNSSERPGESRCSQVFLPR
jgi:hypothetical protein